jgi:diacylglycerol kinase (ATP)
MLDLADSSASPSTAHSSDRLSLAPPAKRSGPLRGWFALRHSYAGIVATLRAESAFRQEAALAAILVPTRCCCRSMQSRVCC